MNTFTFIRNIKNNIMKAMNNNSNQKQIESPTVVKQEERGYSPSVIDKPASKPNLDLSPSVVNIIKTKVNEIENSGNDLGAYAMETCVNQNGKIVGFINTLNIVVSNYKVEAERMEQDVQMELSTQINKFNNLIIKLINEIHSIETFVIPEKIEELKSQEEKVRSLMNTTEYNVSASLSSERLLIMQLAAARTKEIIRELKKKVVELQTEIDQTKISVKGLELQSENINFFNESVLKRRMSLFLNHWVIALVNIDADDSFISETKDVFNDYLDEQTALLAA